MKITLYNNQKAKTTNCFYYLKYLERYFQLLNTIHFLFLKYVSSSEYKSSKVRILRSWVENFMLIAYLIVKLPPFPHFLFSHSSTDKKKGKVSYLSALLKASKVNDNDWLEFEIFHLSLSLFFIISRITDHHHFPPLKIEKAVERSSLRGLDKK